MAQITDYATLVTALNDWAERSDFDEDQMIGLAEAEFRIYFGPNFAKETSATLTFTSGAATVPTGFVRPISVAHATYGTLDNASLERVRERRIWDTTGIPGIYTINGTQVLTAPAYTGDLTFDYEGTLTGLSGSNTTNWLITNAPQAYLTMCKSFVKAWEEDMGSAAMLKAAALSTLGDLGIQAMVAQAAGRTAHIRGATP
jgi:hypothetical protein